MISIDATAPEQEHFVEYLNLDTQLFGQTGFESDTSVTDWRAGSKPSTYAWM